MEVDPIEVQRHLGGVEYPVKKDELIAAADRNDAPQAVVEALQALDQEEFDGPDEVQAALG